MARKPIQSLISQEVEISTPSAIRFLSPYGFIDEFGDSWHWRADQVVRNPYVLGLLVLRNPPVEEV